MPRIQRSNLKGSSFFHIMVQGINKEHIFKTKNNMKKYEKLIYSNKEGLNIIAYCIMGNHAHILIETNEIANISKWMMATNTSYAMYYNKLNKRVGYVFRDRYKSQPIRNLKHLYLCVDYIHNNPVKACLCNSKGEYEFSSFTKKFNKSEISVKNRLDKLIQNNIEVLEINNEIFEKDFILVENEDYSKEEICKKLVKDFLNQRNMIIYELKYKKDSLYELITTLNKANISFRVMEKELMINRETLRKMINKK